MPQEVHAETDYYRIEWDADLDAVIHTWTDFANGEDFRSGANALLEAVEHYDAPNLIVNTSGIRAHDDDDQEWLQREWMPKVIEAGVDCSATVHADSVISEMDMESLMDDLSDMPYDGMVTSDVDEAREWIANQ